MMRKIFVKIRLFLEVSGLFCLLNVIFFDFFDVFWKKLSNLAAEKKWKLRKTNLIV